MCGLFGMIAAPGAERESAICALLALGKESEERGADAAGLAMVVAQAGRRETSDPQPDVVRSRSAGLDRSFIVKGTGRFSALNLAPYREIMAGKPTLFMGHTRAATQGSADDLANTSPLYAGALIGCHNGDVSPESVPGRVALAASAHGGTDSELLFRALDRVRGDRRAMTRVLRQVQGRVALALFDRSRPSRLYLVRGALSPLSYARDEHGNFYYASNPDWFRRVEAKKLGVTFTEIMMVPEGHLLTVSALTGEIESVRRFTPTARERDIRLMSISAYRGFTSEDRAADMALHRHRVVQEPMTAWPTLAPAPTLSKSPALDAKDDRPLPVEEDIYPDEAYDFADDHWADEVEDRYARIDWEHVESLCWHQGWFDRDTFEAILTATEESALEMIDELRESRALDAYAYA